MLKMLVSGLALAAAMALPAASQDWAGFYAGIQVSSETGSITPSGAPFSYDADNISPALVLGYNWQMANNLVLGGEAIIASGTVSNMPILPYEADAVSQVRVRLGYALYRAMPYVALGVGMTDFGVFGGPSSSERGATVGIGLEFLVSDKVSARMEYSRSDFGGVWDDYAPDAFEYEAEALSLGVMYHF
ncbi:outer membrane protein [Pseudogemmobacter blasticus]|nr:outer membrane beta-barrel protein [Fuscovulum blasticum]